MPSTIINLPPPPSDPVTPSEVPGTPNSGTTSLSALSTVAIKDGHQGQSQNSHHHRTPQFLPSQANSSSTTTLEAERADRISRLAGLERLSAVRQPGTSNPSSVAGAAPQTSQQPIGYFDAAGNPLLMKERSTVGSASATGSMGGRTTWASSSDTFDGDKMSEDNTDALSQGGLSDDANASLVGFGEGANSVVDAPISNLPGGIPARSNGQASQARLARMEDGVQNSVPAAPRHAGLSSRETTERIVQERYAARDDEGDVQMRGGDV